MSGEYPFAESNFEISEQACALTVRVLSALRSRLSVNICLRGRKELLDRGQIFLFNHFARFETFGSPTTGWIYVIVEPKDPDLFTIKPRMSRPNRSVDSAETWPLSGRRHQRGSNSDY